MSFEEADDVPLARSSRSTSTTLRPRPAASRAMPTPLMPPPMMKRSTSSFCNGAVESSANGTPEGKDDGNRRSASDVTLSQGRRPLTSALGRVDQAPRLRVSAEGREFGEIDRFAALDDETGGAEQGGEIGPHIACVIGLVKFARKAVEQPVIGRRVAVLQRIEKDEQPARLEEADDLAGDGAAPTRRQLVEEIDRGDDVEAGVGAGDSFCRGFAEFAARPRGEQARGLGKIERAEIERRHREPGVVALDLAQDAPGAAADIEQFRVACAAARQLLAQWHQGL